jgi:hypothetical protein
MAHLYHSQRMKTPIVINRATVEKLASLDAIIAYFDAADVQFRHW